MNVETESIVLEFQPDVTMPTDPHHFSLDTTGELAESKK
jgi:hypothetical protein